MDLKAGGGVGTGKQTCFIPKCKCDFCKKLAGPLTSLAMKGPTLDLCEDCFEQAMAEICNEEGPILDKLCGR